MLERRHTKWIGLGLMLASSAGCATTAARCPANGGRPWLGVTTDHFDIETDLDPSAASSTAVSMERIRDAEIAVLGPAADIPGRARVIVFQDRHALREFGDEERTGLTLTSRHADLVVITTPNSIELDMDSNQASSTIAHEIAHRVSLGAVRHQPRWLAEGLAMYLQTIQVSPDGLQAEVGRPDPESVDFIRKLGPESLSDLWAWHVKPSYGRFANEGILYPTAWAWVSFLRTTQRARFDQFLRDLDGGTSPSDAWAREFPDDLLQGSRVAVGRFALGTIPSETVKLTPRTYAVQVATLTDGEFHATRAELWSLNVLSNASREVRSQHVDAELEEALRMEPTNAKAQRLLAQQHRTKP